MDTPLSPLNDLLSVEQQQSLADILNGLVKFDPETELLKILTPAQIGTLVRDLLDVMSSSGDGRARGYGRVEIVITEGRIAGFNRFIQRKA